MEIQNDRDLMGLIDVRGGAAVCRPPGHVGAQQIKTASPSIVEQRISEMNSNLTIRQELTICAEVQLPLSEVGGHLC